MGGLERQVADYHEREEEVQRLATESKQKVEDALSLKDQASAREDHSYREVNRLMDERGVMLLKRQVRVSHSILQSKDGRVIYKLIRDPWYIFKMRRYSIRFTLEHTRSVSLYTNLTLIALRAMLLQADVDAASEITRQRAAAQRRSSDESLKELSLKNAELIGEIRDSSLQHPFSHFLPSFNLLHWPTRILPRCYLPSLIEHYTTRRWRQVPCCISRLFSHYFQPIITSFQVMPLSLSLFFSSFLSDTLYPLHLSKSLSSTSVVTEKALRDCQSSKEQLDRTAKMRSGHFSTLDLYLHVLQYIFPIKLIIMLRYWILPIPTSLSN